MVMLKVIPTGVLGENPRVEGSIHMPLVAWAKTGNAVTTAPIGSVIQIVAMPRTVLFIVQNLN